MANRSGSKRRGEEPMDVPAPKRNSQRSESSSSDNSSDSDGHESDGVMAVSSRNAQAGTGNVMTLHNAKITLFLPDGGPKEVSQISAGCGNVQTGNNSIMNINNENRIFFQQNRDVTESLRLQMDAGKLKNTRTLDLNDDNTEDISVRVMKRGELQHYPSPNSPTGQMSYFNIVGLNNHQSRIDIRVYQPWKLETIRPERTYKFTKIKKQSKNTYWAVWFTKIGFTINIPADPATPTSFKLPEEYGPSGMPRTLISAVHSFEKSTIEGRLVQATPIRCIKAGTLAIRTLVLKDSSGIVKVDIFGEQAEQIFPEGKAMTISSVYQKEYNEDRQRLRQSQSSEIRFLKDGPKHVSISKRDKIDDPEFVERQVKIEVFDNFGIYDCCDKTGCWQKGLDDGGNCKRCGLSPDTQIKGCYVRCDVTDKEESGTIVLFKEELSKILSVDSEDELLNDKEEALDKLCGKLPWEFTCNIIDGKGYNISN